MERLEKEKILEQSRQKMAFFTNLSNELKTPLSRIIAPVSQLLPATETEHEKQTLEEVQRNAMKVWEDIQNAVEGPTYRERLEADPEAKLTKETLDEIFDPWDFLTRKDEVFKRLENLEF